MYEHLGGIMQEGKVLGTFGSGEVVVDRPKSHLEPELRKILPTILQMLEVHHQSANPNTPLLRLVTNSELALWRMQRDESELIRLELTLPEVAKAGDWKTQCVQVKPEDKVLYLQRQNRGGPSRFVSRQPEPTDKVVLMLNPKEQGQKWVLVTGFFGELPEKEPWDRNIQSDEEYERCMQFWKYRALTLPVSHNMQQVAESVFWKRYGS